jgi:hypothetical protein
MKDMKKETMMNKRMSESRFLGLNDEQDLKGNEKSILKSSNLVNSVSDNKQGWEIKSLGEIADVEYGFTDKSMEEGDYRYVRITDIDSNGELIPTEKKIYKTFKRSRRIFNS